MRRLTFSVNLELTVDHDFDKTDQCVHLLLDCLEEDFESLFTSNLRVPEDGALEYVSVHNIQIHVKND